MKQSTLPQCASVVALLFLSMIVAAPATADHHAEKDGFRSIFNGVNLEGWDGNPEFWRVEDGAITGETTPEKPTRGNTFVIWRGGELDDFELTLEYRIFAGNSGIQYRSFEDEKKYGKWVIGGYQADLEAGDRWSGTLYGEKYRGVLGARGQQTVIGANHKPRVTGAVGDRKALQQKIRSKDWNTYHISARGYHFQHRINGTLMVDVIDEDMEMRRRGGLLALQLHAGPPMKVQFRNIRLKRLPMGDVKKVVFVAGHRSHGYGAHEFNAGSLLLKKALDENAPGIHGVVYKSGWPYDPNPKPGANLKDPTAFDNADGIVLFMNGGGGHPVNRDLEAMDRVMKRGVGLACIHYAVEVPKGKPGNAFLDWIGGYFETHWSVNPHWKLEKTVLGKHPINNGVKPYEIDDEWYFNMRFREGMKGVTPILTATPPLSTIKRRDGPHSNNPTVRKLVTERQPTHLAWAATRPDGGRGFGFTGAHHHWNWANDDCRKQILNAIVWITGKDVPAEGVPSKTPTREELEANQDYPKRR